MNNLLCISGPSGVGKTTISNLISSVLDVDSCVMVSGDDSHKWERNNKMWKSFTHLDPEANNIKQEFDFLSKLKNNETVTRRKYNHENGLFDEPIKVEPKKNIIYEGLHALYLEDIRNISDLKIYVDTDEELKIAWKIDRDKRKRGYSEKEIVEVIQRRLLDEEKYIIPQKEHADVIVKFTFNGLEVNFDYKFITQNVKYKKLFQDIKKFYEQKKEFLKICNMLSENDELVQNKGGNVSFKYQDKIIITSSGIELKNVSMFEGICILSLKDKNMFVFKNGNPSLELDCHFYSPDSTIHAHPKHILTFLCCDNSETIIGNLYNNYEFDYVPYVSPGKNLSEKIKECKNKIIFCQNHGIFIRGATPRECFSVLKELDSLAESKIQKNNYQNEPEGHLFPDSCVLEEKNKLFNKTLYNSIISNNLKPRFLTKEETQELLNMEEEKYRSKK